MGFPLGVSGWEAGASTLSVATGECVVRFAGKDGAAKRAAEAPAARRWPPACARGQSGSVPRRGVLRQPEAYARLFEDASSSWRSPLGVGMVGEAVAPLAGREALFKVHDGLALRTRRHGGVFIFRRRLW